MSGHLGTAAMQRTESGVSLLKRLKLPAETVLSANKRDRGCRWSWGRFLREKGPHKAGKWITEPMAIWNRQNRC